MEIEVLDEFIADINPWGNLYIIAAEESLVLANGFKDELEKQDISTILIVEGMEDKFKANLSEDDLVLAISRSGREDYIRSMVKIALKSKVKVYGICGNFRSPLAMFAEEVIVIKDADYFEKELLEIIEYLCRNLSEDAENEEYKIQQVGWMEIDDSKPEPPEQSVFSPFLGMIIKVNVNVGDEVNEGDVICIVESMKMENEVLSDRTGIVEEIFVEVGDAVGIDDAIMVIK